MVLSDKQNKQQQHLTTSSTTTTKIDEKHHYHHHHDNMLGTKRSNISTTSPSMTTTTTTSKPSKSVAFRPSSLISEREYHRHDAPSATGHSITTIINNTSSPSPSSKTRRLNYSSVDSSVSTNRIPVLKPTTASSSTATSTTYYAQAFGTISIFLFEFITKKSLFNQQLTIGLKYSKNSILLHILSIYNYISVRRIDFIYLKISKRSILHINISISLYFILH